MFCPKCKCEYRKGFAECADCKVPLVSELPPEPKREPEPKFSPKPAPELVEVWRAYGEIDAQLIRSVLECNGVECMLSGDALRLTHGITVDGLGEVRVLVRSADAKRAQEILAASESMLEGSLSA